MCNECLKTPCHPSCPNADEPKPIASCSVCYDDIYKNDDYWSDYIGTVKYYICNDCIERGSDRD